MLKYLLISWIILLAGLGRAGGEAAQPAGPEPGLEAALSSSTSALAAGEAARLSLYLAPPAGKTVEIVSLRPAGGDAWTLVEAPPLPLEVTHPTTLEITLAAQKTGRLRPVLRIDYRLDGQPGQALVEGEWLEVALPRQALGIPWNYLATFAFGAASAIVSNLVIEECRRLRQEALNRERAFGLLRLVIAQARAAVEHGEALDLAPLQMIFQSEGLYKALRLPGLDGPALEVWGRGFEHNRFVGRRQGWQPETALATAASRLETALEKQEAALAKNNQGPLGWMKRWLRRE